MLDVDVIRKNPEQIRAMLRNRNYSEETLEQFLSVDGEWRRIIEESNQLKRQRNLVAEQIPKLKDDEKRKRIAEMKEVANRISDLDARAASLEESRAEIVLNIPNMPDATVPIGPSPTDNVMIREGGITRQFDFAPKDHIAIGEDLDILDFKRGAKVAGSGFYVLTGIPGDLPSGGGEPGGGHRHRPVPKDEGRHVLVREGRPLAQPDGGGAPDQPAPG
jgi:seryl-tRNA synthetase